MALVKVSRSRWCRAPGHIRAALHRAGSSSVTPRGVPSTDSRPLTSKAMNGLSPETPLHSLVGAQVSQICFGLFQCILNFDIDMSISIESKCLYTSPLGDRIPITSYAKCAVDLCELLGINVTSAGEDIGGGLIIRFVNDATLHVLNDNKEFESFQIRIGKTIHVA